MFGMGWNEILIVMAIAVIVVGPKQLPQVARTVGKLVAQFKRATNDLRDAVNREVSEQTDLDELREMKTSFESEIRNIKYDSSSYISREFDEERKIGEGVQDDLKAAAGDIPTRDFDLPADDPPADDAAAEGAAAAPEKAAAEGDPASDAAVATPAADGEEQPAEAEETEKPPGGRYV